MKYKGIIELYEMVHLNNFIYLNFEILVYSYTDCDNYITITF